jgi:predicted DNA-binding transcriptional regulator YafY
MQFYIQSCSIIRGGHRHFQIGRMHNIDLISEPPHAPSPQIYVSKVWESVWQEGQEAIHS